LQKNQARKETKNGYLKQQNKSHDVKMAHFPKNLTTAYKYLGG